MNNDKTILLTGVTGLLGAYILKLILVETDFKIVLIIRAKDRNQAKKRFMISLTEKFGECFCQAFSKRIDIIRGDITKKNLSLNQNECYHLRKTVNEIYHCAALAEFRQPIERVRNVNVEGTENLFEFACRCSKLSKVNYIISTFIAGNNKGRFSENDLNRGQRFNNTYEQSKFEAELLLNRYKNKDFKIVVYRPSIVVGEYASGMTNNFKGFPFRYRYTLYSRVFYYLFYFIHFI